MTDTLKTAAAASQTITAHVATARRCLDEFRDVSRNGAGVLASPSHQRRDLAAAVDELKKALDVFDGTNWPTKQDYQAL